MRTKHLFVLIHIIKRVRFVPSNMFKPSSNILTVPRQCFFCGSVWMCVSCLSFILYCLFLAALWSPAGKGMTSWLACVLSLSHKGLWVKCGI